MDLNEQRLYIKYCEEMESSKEEDKVDFGTWLSWYYELLEDFEKDNYEFIKYIKSNRRLKIGSNQKVSTINEKFKKMRIKVKASKAEGVELLGRMYSFDKYRIDEKTKQPVKIKAKTSKKTEYVIITSLYPVLDNWYFKANP